jgi:hypothetical protein
MKAPIPWLNCILSLRKYTFANTTKIKLNMVMKVVMVVDEGARRGIFKRALLVIMKAKRAKRAHPIEMMNLQFKIKFRIPSREMRFPEIRLRFPSKTIEIAVATENKMVHKKTGSISLN